MVELRFPIKLKIDAFALEDGNWRVNYEEHFTPEHFEAFNNSFKLMKETAEKIEGYNVTFDKDDCTIHVSLEAPRGVVFSFMCGEFFSLSSFSRLTLLDLFVGSGLAGLDISGRNVKG